MLHTETKAIDKRSPTERTSHALRGAIIGAIVGVIAAGRMLKASIDPTVTDHGSIFPAAVVVLCVAACVAVAFCALCGAAVGYCFKKPIAPRQPNSSEDS